MTVITIKHTDVKGKDTHYIKLTNKHNSEHFISVGKKTYEAVKLLTDEEQNRNQVEGNNH